MSDTIFQVAASEVLPASMFLPVPGSEKLAHPAQNDPQSLPNSTSEESKKQTGDNRLECCMHKYFLHLLKC